MNELAIFKNDQFGEVRVVMVSEEPWFVAKDVCQALEIANYRDAVSTLDEDEKGVANTDTHGGKQEMIIVSESGLYALVFKSRKKEARKFRKWITLEVIPAICKTGKYEAVEPRKPQRKEPLSETLKVTKMILRAAGIKGERLALGLNNAAINLSGINHLAISGENLITPTQEPLMTPTQIGEAMNGISARAVNQILLAEGFQKKDGGVWRLTEKGKKYGEVTDTGKMHGGSPISHIKWRGSVIEAISHQ